MAKHYPSELKERAVRLVLDSEGEPGARRIAELEGEVRELRRANAILRSASAFFAAELDRPPR